MNIGATIIAVAFAALATVDATTINHDQVQPFAQPKPVTVSEKAAVKYKPSIKIGNVCHPYPAVNAAGETSGGLKASGPATGECEGSGLGSQIYGRAGWHGDMWAIMYAWYFPKSYRRHEWEHMVVWLDNPALKSPKVTDITAAIDGMATIDDHRLDASDYMDGTSPNVYYDSTYITSHILVLSKTSGEFQDLIMWEQLTDEARASLEDTDFGDSTVPFKDATFQENLK